MWMMMPPGACGGWKGKGKMMGKFAPPAWSGGGGWGGGGGGGGGSWGVPNLTEALTEALAEVGESGETITKLSTKAQKVADKFSKDERITAKGTSTQAKALVEELVENIMGSWSGSCYEKPWFSQVNWTQPMLMIVLYAFENTKMFTRVLKPKLLSYIEDGVFKWQEEERITKAMWDAVAASGVQESHQKKANTHLLKAYEEAHFNAPYGSTTNDSPELTVLQDFVKGWMTEFLSRGWDVLENGLADKGKDSQISTLAALFQNLLDPNVACMPYEIASEITNSLGGLPASPWPFIDEAAAQVYTEAEMAAAGGPQLKKPRMF